MAAHGPMLKIDERKPLMKEKPWMMCSLNY
jgi:hypothetical protein